MKLENLNNMYKERIGVPRVNEDARRGGVENIKENGSC